MRYTSLIFLSLIFSLSALSQEFTYSDSLRGNLSEFRSCYDVYYYDLDITVDDYQQKIINSYNNIHIKALSDFQTIQIDLFENLKIHSIQFEHKKLEFQRIHNAVFINLAVEFFPIRSSGGFFSTSNSSYIFLLLGLVLIFSIYYNRTFKKK